MTCTPLMYAKWGAYHSIGKLRSRITGGEIRSKRSLRIAASCWWSSRIDCIIRTGKKPFWGILGLELTLILQILDERNMFVMEVYLINRWGHYMITSLTDEAITWWENEAITWIRNEEVMTFTSKNRISNPDSAVAKLEAEDYPASWIEPALGKQSSPQQSDPKSHSSAQNQISQKCWESSPMASRVIVYEILKTRFRVALH